MAMREVVNVEADEFLRRGDLVELGDDGKAQRHQGMPLHHGEALPPCTCGHPRSDHWSSGDPVPMCTACDCRRYAPECSDYRCDHRWYTYYADRRPKFRMCLDCCAESAVALTPSERSTIATAKVAASAEVDSLIAIIERLACEVVPAADGECWTVCLQCKAQIHDPASLCPECGADIDRQYAGHGKVAASGSFRHSKECTETLHGESLAGCLKVRWTNGKHSWYNDCCAGEWVPAADGG